MDYRELLKRYIAFVGQEEGITFIDRLSASWNDPAIITGSPGNEVKFTLAEYEALRQLEREGEADVAPGQP